VQKEDGAFMNEEDNILQLHKNPWPEITSASYRYFYEGEKHINRICSYYVLIFMLERSLIFTEDHKEIELKKGEWYIQKPNLLQQGITGCPAPEYFYIHFNAKEMGNSDFSLNQIQYDDKKDELPYIDSQKDYNNPIIIAKRGLYDIKLLKSFFEQLDYSLRNNPFDLLSHQSIFLNILKYITLSEAKETDHGLAKQVILYLTKNYMTDVNCERLSEEFHFSTEYINRLVKKYCGLSPGQYLQQYRITRAKELLANTDHTLSYITTEVGYHDTTVFYKAFKKHTGMAPGLWRDKSRGI
jgi:AraC-like DNA-binding protein